MLSFLAYLALAFVGFQQAPPPPPPKPEQTAPPPVEQTAPPKPEQTAPPKPEQTAPPKPEQTAPPKPEQTAPPPPVEQTAPPKPEQTAAPKPAEQPAAARPVSAARRLAEPEKPGPIVLPMELVSGRPVIRLMVNGKGPYAFLVSTGAQTTMIDQKLAVELALKPPVPEKDKPNAGSNGNGSGAPAAKENANGNPKENAKENKEAKDKDKKAVPLLELDLEAGTTKLAKVPVLATDITAFVAEAGLAGRSRGVLSLSAWKDHLVTISFPPKFKVTIEPGTLPEPNAEDVFPLDPETGELRLSVKVADQSIACRVEPLAPGGLQMPEEYLKRLLLDGPPIELGTTTVANQSVTIREARLAYSAMLASFELVNPVVRFVGAGDSATAGSQALVGLSISYDLANNRARIVRLPPPEKK